MVKGKNKKTIIQFSLCLTEHELEKFNKLKNSEVNRKNVDLIYKAIAELYATKFKESFFSQK